MNQFATVAVSVLVVIVLSRIPEVYGRTHRSRCRSLSDEERQQKENELNMFSGLHWTFCMIPSLRNATQNAGNVLEVLPREEFRSSTRTTLLHGESVCPRGPVQEECPVHFVLHNDINRIPENMVHAVCSCRRCRHTTSFVHRCVKSYAYIPVYRLNDNCEYIKGLEPVPVGCCCARMVLNV